MASKLEHYMAPELMRSSQISARHRRERRLRKVILEVARDDKLSAEAIRLIADELYGPEEGKHDPACRD